MEGYFDHYSANLLFAETFTYPQRSFAKGVVQQSKNQYIG